ncbi:MAG: aldehyde-activating protein [Ramlibacter sp.]|uniref:GFA family protein n=1 Tax=Ramlibacter sp. TaxID=1917967 RepID=UPI002611521F|nr:GFA family protein [Ramlibacter sp.]MDB5753223.1 aldehyde-activating protein [Ramlibacter sp.]
MASDRQLKGGCFCDEVRYEAEGEAARLTNCHCTICRRVSGAPFVAWFTVSRARFRFVRGEPTCFRSSPTGTRGFCGRCGSQLTFASDDAPHEIDVTTCTLDEPEALPSQDHTYVRSKLDWVTLADGLPRHWRARDDAAQASVQRVSETTER